MENKCKNCKYWAQQSRQSPGEKTAPCQRFPPAVFPMQQQSPITGQVGLGFVSSWPSTQPDNTCGEFALNLKTQGVQ